MSWKNGNKTVYMGILLSFALILSYVESLIPFYFGVPGVKLGLANLAVVIVLYWYGWKEAIMLNAVRVLLAGFLFGNLFMVMYSLAGAICSFLMMYLLKRSGRFSIMGVSMAGGIFHNVGQIGIAVFATKAVSVVYYLPVLMVAGIVTGFLVGIAAREFIGHMEKVLQWRK